MTDKRRKKLPMTVQECWPVRWGTKHEESDAMNLITGLDYKDGILGRLVEDFSRALDRAGWQITNQIDPEQKWPVDAQYGYVPAWGESDEKKSKPTLLRCWQTFQKR